LAETSDAPARITGGFEAVRLQAHSRENPVAAENSPARGFFIGRRQVHLHTASTPTAPPETIYFNRTSHPTRRIPATEQSSIPPL